MANLKKKEDRSIWNNMKTPKVLERMRELYETSKWYDCVFKLWNSDGTKEELVFAHNLVLASSSPVFEALFFGPLAEDRTIEVPDVDPLAFRMMLKFIYTDCIEFTSVEMACNVLYASKKYLIYSLAGFAISYISDFIDETSCLQVYNFASFIQEERLLKESWSYLCSHLDFVFNYFSKESLTTDLVKNLVNEKALNGEEIILYKICLLWAEAECDNNNLEKNSANLRKVLIQAELLNKIRWLTLTLEEFEEGPKKSGILTNEEITFISEAIKLINHDYLDLGNKSDAEQNGDSEGVKNLSGPDIDTLRSIIRESKLFPFSISSDVLLREKIKLKRLYCHRYFDCEITPKLNLYSELKIRTHIISNKSVKLIAFSFSSRNWPMSQLSNSYAHTQTIGKYYNEKLFVSLCDPSNKVIFSMPFYKKVRYGTIIKISLEKPVILERLKEYIIQIDLLDSPENYVYGIGNSVLKFPCGLCVNFKEEASLGTNGEFLAAKQLSIISVLELHL